MDTPNRFLKKQNNYLNLQRKYSSTQRKNCQMKIKMNYKLTGVILNIPINNNASRHRFETEITSYFERCGYLFMVSRRIGRRKFWKTYTACFVFDARIDEIIFSVDRLIIHPRDTPRSAYASIGLCIVWLFLMLAYIFVS